MPETPGTPTSVQDRLRSARKALLVNERVTLEVPGYSGLFAHYRILDFPETRAVGKGIEKAGIKDEVQRELYQAADTLLAASIGVEAHIDGDVVDLDMKLGNGLAEYLDLGACENDRQAVFAIFLTKGDVMDQFVELQSHKAYADREADRALLGESEAVGS
jgi:hypothetical protein